jgi:pyruvate/2-oxoglutarate/acetoin dehydrogenase E1 component
MPDLGTTESEVTLAFWFKEEGDTVKRGEPLFVVEADKATIDLESIPDGYFSTLAEDAAEWLVAPVRRIAAPNTPAPFAPVMERFYVPQVEHIVSAVKDVTAY